MRIFLLILSVISPIFLSGKETKKITNDRGYPAFREVYYVLKADTNIRHGSYRAEILGKVAVKGFYQMGYKDSLWTQYNLQGKIRSRGWYEHGKRDSIWEFFNHSGEIEQRINFTRNEVLLYQTAFLDVPFRVMNGKDTILTVLERPPLFIGGTSRFNDYVADEIMIPLHKADEKITGTVYVAFTIDKEGKTSNHRVLKGIGKVCNAEALRVMMTIPDDWIPGRLNGENVAVDYVVPFKFDKSITTIDSLFQ